MTHAVNQRGRDNAVVKRLDREADHWFLASRTTHGKRSYGRIGLSRPDRRILTIGDANVTDLVSGICRANDDLIGVLHFGLNRAQCRWLRQDFVSSGRWGLEPKSGTRQFREKRGIMFDFGGRGGTLVMVRPPEASPSRVFAADPLLRAGNSGIISKSLLTPGTELAMIDCMHGLMLKDYMDS
jgi:hypothetical protein